MCPHTNLVSDDGSRTYFHCLDCRKTLYLLGPPGRTVLVIVGTPIDQERKNGPEGVPNKS